MAPVKMADTLLLTCKNTCFERLLARIVVGSLNHKSIGIGGQPGWILRRA